MLYRTYILILTILLTTSYFAWRLYSYYPNIETSSELIAIPLRISETTSKELPVDKDKFDSLERKTTSVINRKYTTKENKEINLYVIYSKFNPKAVYPPEISYPESNVSILDKGREVIKINDSKSIKVNWLLLDTGIKQEIVYYWFKVGDINTTSYWKQQILIAFNNVMGNRRGSALIQVSTDIIDSHQQEATKVINKFTGLITPQLSDYLP